MYTHTHMYTHTTHAHTHIHTESSHKHRLDLHLPRFTSGIKILMLFSTPDRMSDLFHERIVFRDKSPKNRLLKNNTIRVNYVFIMYELVDNIN